MLDLYYARSPDRKACSRKQSTAIGSRTTAAKPDYVPLLAFTIDSLAQITSANNEVAVHKSPVRLRGDPHKQPPRSYYGTARGYLAETLMSKIAHVQAECLSEAKWLRLDSAR